MFRNIIRTFGLTAMIAVLALSSAHAQQGIVRDYNDNDKGEYDPDQIKVDRYLTTEIWTNHEDGEYFEGDNIVISFLTNRDAFVIIYSVDTRGRLNLLFPVSADEDNFVEGGQVYRLPGSNDDFDLVVNGPEGVETIQIIASRDRIPIPKDWYPQSGLTDDGWEDRYDFMDYINSQYFVRYTGQRFAFDRTSLSIDEWEPDYYQPVYYPDYPSWTVTGNVYIDYPYGGTVYINGVYWGVAPLYIPRIYVGWHTLTIYDPYGYCWENDIHITRYNTLILDRHIIIPSRTIVSRYKEVSRVGYRDPVKYGYPSYKTKDVVSVSTSKVNPSAKTTTKSTTVIEKKFVRGTSSAVIKTERGYETKGTGISGNSKMVEKRTSERTTTKSGTSERIKSTSRKESSSGKITTGSQTKTSSGVYKRNSGSKNSSSSSGTKRVKKSSTESKSSSSVGKSSEKSKSASSSTVKQKSSSSSSSSSSGKSSSGSSSKSSKSSDDGKSSGGKKKN